MTDLSTKTAVVVDNGMFVSFAKGLVPFFGSVRYWCPNYSNYPTRHLSEIGSGIPGLDRIKKFWETVREFDDDQEHVVFIFLDIHFGDWQQYLREHGFHVWGSGLGEDLELFRWDAKRLQRELGLPVGPAVLIKGVPNLREYLDKNPEVWVKVSEYRGIGETWKSWDGRLSDARLNAMDHDLGPLADEQEFIVEKTIKTCGEVGYDGINIKGQFPTGIATLGYEAKDIGYIGAAMPYAKLPKEVLTVNEKLSPAFKGFGYQGFYSSEIRIGEDGKPYVVDHTCRHPSPPGELYTKWFTNIAQIIWEGAHGRIVDIKPSHPYAAEIILTSEFAANDWLAVKYPPEIEDYVRLYGNLRRKGLDFVTPTDAKLVQIGGVLGFGNTVAAALKQAVERAEQVRGDGINFKREAIPQLLDTLRESVKNGVYFGDSPIPEKI